MPCNKYIFTDIPLYNVLSSPVCQADFPSFTRAYPLKGVRFLILGFVSAYSHSEPRENVLGLFHSLLALGITICLVVAAGFQGFKGQDVLCKFWWISLRGYRPSCKPFWASTTGLISLLGNVHYPLTFTTISSARSGPRRFHSCSLSCFFPNQRCYSPPGPSRVSSMSCR